MYHLPTHFLQPILDPNFALMLPEAKGSLEWAQLFAARISPSQRIPLQFAVQTSGPQCVWFFFSGKAFLEQQEYDCICAPKEKTSMTH